MKIKILVGLIVTAISLGEVLSVGAVSKGSTDVTNTSNSKIISIKKFKALALNNVNGKVKDIEIK